MNYNSTQNRYPSRRSVVYSNRGMVCTSQPLAAQAGLDILKMGGNAIDAAIATAICLTVVEPTSNGIGGDSFALVWNNNKMFGLNASGPAPELISAEAIKKQGFRDIPETGWMPVTVPGAPSAWAELSNRFGTLAFEQLFKPAIDYAENGFPVSPVIAQLWEKEYEKFSELNQSDLFNNWFDTFAPDGTSPKPGEIWSSQDHADTLRIISATKAEAFYRGVLAEQIDQFSKSGDGFIRYSDLEKYNPEWVTPIKINYKGYEIWEMPPNTQGLVALLGLNILNGFDFKEKETVSTYHLQIEALKNAFSDGIKYIADPKYMTVDLDYILSESYAAKKRASLTEEAVYPSIDDQNKGGTVYLCSADAHGNMVSYIQSNYKGFGSGLVVPKTGIALHNRGKNFSLNKNSVNYIEPGKKPYHTIIPAFLTKDGKAIGPFGVMGGFMQPQGHLQIVSNMVDFNLHPQEALDAPRWQWLKGNKIIVEKGISSKIKDELILRGHQVEEAKNSLDFGRGQIILKDENNVLVGATEPRADGTVAAW